MGKLLKEIPLLEKEDIISLAMTMLYFISKDSNYETILSAKVCRICE